MRERFIVLDGLRGLAALTVVFFHTPALLAPWGGYRPNGWLAVDFFFCLSGFVLANAHEHQFRQRQLTVGRFMAMRLIRIAPMLMLGTILGLLLSPWMFVGKGHPHGADLLPTFLMSAICLPWIRAGEVYWMNGVFWSLLAELIANLFYGLTASSLSNRKLALIVSVSGLVLLWGAISARTMDFAFRDLWEFGYTIARAATSFFIGVSLLRVYRWLPRKPDVATWVPMTALLCALAIHLVHWMMRVNVVLIFTVVPLIVLLGSLARPCRTWMLRQLGEGSFPLYAVHAPIVVAIARVSTSLVPIVQTLLFFILPLTLLAASVWIGRYLDEPIRRFLRSNLLRSRHRTSMSA